MSANNAQSLMSLSQSFVELYGLSCESELCLDKSSQMLGIEKRRIYDIVNVFESVGVVARTGKNKYTWYGDSRLEATLKALRIPGRAGAAPADTYAETPVGHTLPTAAADSIGQPMAYSAKAKNAKRELAPTKGRTENRRDKSLGILSQRFVQLLMVYGDMQVTVDEAAQSLLADQVPGMDSSILKTKARRLYDIANILSALKLVEKCVTVDRRPAFRWLGPNVGTFKTEAEPLHTRFSSAAAAGEAGRTQKTQTARKPKTNIERKSIMKRPRPVDSELRQRKKVWKEYCDKWIEALGYVLPKKDISNVTLEQYPLAWLDAFDVDGYMEKARQAGVEYERAAETWKEEIQQWKSIPENYYPPWNSNQ